jgi:hypothetical protein
MNIDMKRQLFKAFMYYQNHLSIQDLRRDLNYEPKAMELIDYWYQELYGEVV